MPRHKRPADGAEFLSVAEVAARLGLSEMTVYRMLDRGELAEHRFGKARKVAAADLEAYIAASRVETRAAG